MAKKRGTKSVKRGKRIKDLPVNGLQTVRAKSVKGGRRQKPDGTAAGNVAAKWSIAQGAVS